MIFNVMKSNWGLKRPPFAGFFPLENWGHAECSLQQQFLKKLLYFLLLNEMKQCHFNKKNWWFSRKVIVLQVRQITSYLKTSFNSYFKQIWSCLYKYLPYGIQI